MVDMGMVDMDKVEMDMVDMGMVDMNMVDMVFRFIPSFSRDLLCLFFDQSDFTSSAAALETGHHQSSHTATGLNCSKHIFKKKKTNWCKFRLNMFYKELWRIL